MKKKIIASVLLLSSLSLGACNVKNVTKTETPEEVIKELQVNLVDSFKSTVFAKQNAEWNSSLNINAKAPVGKASIDITMDSKQVDSTWEANIDLNGSFDFNIGQALSWDFAWKIKLISTFEKLYVNLEDFNIKSSNPQLAMYNTVVSMMKGKWFYIPADPQSKQLSKVFKSISLKDELKKYNIFKVNKKLADYKYDVSIDKKNLANIVYDISKKIDPSYTWTVNDIEKQLQWDIKGILSVEENKKYFTLSGDLIFADNSKVPFVLEHTEKKFLVNINNSSFVLDLDKDGDNFKGYALFKNQQAEEFKFTIDGLLNSDTFKSNLNFNENGITVDVTVKTTLKDIDKVNITIPKDAVPLSELQKQLWGR